MHVDSELSALFAARSAPDGYVAPERGDALALRKIADAAFLEYSTSETPDVIASDFEVWSPDGAAIGLRWYTSKWHSAGGSGPAVVFAHGGGRIAGSVELYDIHVRQYVQDTAVPFLSVEYRLAPEFGGTTAARDVFSAVQWLFAHALGLGVDTSRIAVMGDSAGGGVAAAAAILARDHKVPVAKQILVYPMLDDRNIVGDPELAQYATFNYDNNFTCWTAVLGEAVGGPSVSPIAAPGRLVDFNGLAPAYIEVGEIDIFRDESIDYARNLHAAGVSCSLSVYPGVPHGHDWISRDLEISRRSLSDRHRAIKSL